MANRFPPFPEDATVEQMYHPAMEIVDQAEADEYFERLVEHMTNHGETRQKAEEIVRSNLGYVSGYHDVKTVQRVFGLFRCAHPVFGASRPDAETAFEIGLEAGRKLKEKGERFRAQERELEDM